MRKNRILSILLILILLLAVPVSAVSKYGSIWTGRYKERSKDFRAYISYKWEPMYSDTEARLTIRGYGIQCLSETRNFSLPKKSVKKASVSANIKPIGKKKTVSKSIKGKVKFADAEKNAKVKFGSVTWKFKRTKKNRTLKVTYRASKGKQLGKKVRKGYRNAWRGSSKGTLTFTVPAAPDYVYNGLKFKLPSESRGTTAKATVTTAKGKSYTYKMFKQSAGYNNYSDYLKLHGCSTCALTTIINTMKGKSLTPDKTIDLIKKVDPEEYAVNFTGDSPKNLPIALPGIAKVLKAQGIKYKYGTNDVKELSDWLNKGKPVIMTIGNGGEGGLSATIHTILLLGIDQKGHVVIGDSVLKSASIWGKDGLVKHGRLTVEDMMSYLKSTTWNEAEGHFFYKSYKDRGYILVG